MCIRDSSTVTLYFFWKLDTSTWGIFFKHVVSSGALWSSKFLRWLRYLKKNYACIFMWHAINYYATITEPSGPMQLVRTCIKSSWWRHPKRKEKFSRVVVLSFWSSHYFKNETPFLCFFAFHASCCTVFQPPYATIKKISAIPDWSGLRSWGVHAPSNSESWMAV